MKNFVFNNMIPYTDIELPTVVLSDAMSLVASGIEKRRSKSVHLKSKIKILHPHRLLKCLVLFYIKVSYPHDPATLPRYSLLSSPCLWSFLQKSSPQGWLTFGQSAPTQQERALFCGVLILVEPKFLTNWWSPTSPFEPEAHSLPLDVLPEKL